MANTKSAKKSVRQDKKRRALNSSYKTRYKKAVKTGMADKKGKSLGKTMAAIDKAAKKGVIHKNKAARLKSRISKISSGKNG